MTGMMKPYRRLPGALALLVPLTAAAPAPTETQALRAFERHDYARAHTIWLDLARHGDGQAAFRLGLLADVGEGGPEDAAAAYHWFQQAAQSGLAEAEFNVAVLKDSGRGTPHDASGAAEWYARAAAHGNRRAQYNLGLLYKAGDGVPRNQAAASAWFHEAATNGLPAAAAKLEAVDRTPSEARLDRSATLRPVIPVSPLAAATVPMDQEGATVFVWTAPTQPAPTRFFLQVVTHEAGSQREIHAAYTDLTAALVHLGGDARTYSWRVFTVSPQSRSYVVTAWTQFHTGLIK